jgi:hypothetical protein
LNSLFVIQTKREFYLKGSLNLLKFEKGSDSVKKNVIVALSDKVLDKVRIFSYKDRSF